MSIHLLKDRGTPIQQQRFTWRELVQAPYSKLDDDAFTRVRVILMNGIESEAVRFACNAVVVGKTVVLNAGSEQLTRDLEARGCRCVAVELDEFLKAGGSAKCLTLRLDGEEAAGWKSAR